MGVLTAPVKERCDTGYLKASFGRKKNASLRRFEHRYCGGGREEYRSCFCHCPLFFSFWRYSEFGSEGACDSMAPTCSFCYTGPHYLHERGLHHPLRSGEGNIQGNFCSADSFIHFSQLTTMGLVWLNRERRAHSQRGGEQQPSPSAEAGWDPAGKTQAPGRRAWCTGYPASLPARQGGVL